MDSKGYKALEKALIYDEGEFQDILHEYDTYINIQPVPVGYNGYDGPLGMQEGDDARYIEIDWLRDTSFDDNNTGINEVDVLNELNKKGFLHDPNKQVKADKNHPRLLPLRIGDKSIIFEDLNSL